MKTRQQPHDRRLARPRRSHYGNQRSLRCTEADAVENLLIPVPEAHAAELHVMPVGRLRCGRFGKGGDCPQITQRSQRVAARTETAGQRSRRGDRSGELDDHDEHWRQMRRRHPARRGDCHGDDYRRREHRMDDRTQPSDGRPLRRRRLRERIVLGPDHLIHHRVRRRTVARGANRLLAAGELDQPAGDGSDGVSMRFVRLPADPANGPVGEEDHRRRRDENQTDAPIHRQNSEGDDGRRNHRGDDGPQDHVRHGRRKRDTRRRHLRKAAGRGLGDVPEWQRQHAFAQGTQQGRQHRCGIRPADRPRGERQHRMGGREAGDDAGETPRRRIISLGQSRQQRQQRDERRSLGQRGKRGQRNEPRQRHSRAPIRHRPQFPNHRFPAFSSSDSVPRGADGSSSSANARHKSR